MYFSKLLLIVLLILLISQFQILCFFISFNQNIMKNRIRNFQIQTKLGSGSYGVIYKALNKTSKDVCVLKQISLSRLNQKAKKNAINEATIMGKLTHPFIVRYQQSFIQENTLNIIMEFCDSGDLSNYLKLQNKKPLKEEKIWKFFIEICVGLQYIHKNKILHRDIKTLNIFMNKNDEIKIGDLGVAKMLNSNDFAQTMVGTPFYLSPELCEQKPYNEKSDIWALGCLLYELCTFRHPFEAQNQPSLILKIIRGKYLPIPQFYSKQLKQLIEICLERDYKRRPTTSNLLAKPKMQEYYKQFGIDKIVDQYMNKIRNEKQPRIIAKPIQQPKTSQQQRDRNIKVIDQEFKKEVKKQEFPKKEEIKKQQVKKDIPISKPTQNSQKKIQKDIVQIKKEQNIIKKDSKQEFAVNLEKLIDQSNKKNIKQGPSYAEIQPKISEAVKKQQKYQKVLSKVQEIKKDQKNIDYKSPIIDNKKYTPLIPEKKAGLSMDVAPVVKKQQIIQQKPSLIKPQLAKPPLPSSANKEAIKVKNEKVVQPKVYQSQKAISKPQVVIKSAGFNNNLQNPLEKIQKQQQYSNSKEKPQAQRNIGSAKRPSVPALVKQQKVDKDQIKQLFGAIQSPSIDRKSEKNIKNQPSFMQEPKVIKKEESAGNVSRVRKGGQNILSRNARNVSRYNEISKQQKDEVMNLPTKINNKGNSSSDSQQEDPYTKRKNNNEDIKGKTNKKFKLKEIDDDLVLQKYEDIINNESQSRETVPDTFQQESNSQLQTNNQLQRNINDDINRDNVLQKQNDENIAEDLDYLRRNSSDEQIQEMLESQLQQEDLQKEQDLQKQCADQDQAPYYQRQEQEWSYDQQPQLPLLQQKQSPYFQQNNPYLVEQQQQQQSEQNKKNYLQTKLTQNLKRQDEINKLMQIKIDECRKFIGNEKNFQEILVFFRKKLNMDDQYNQEDQKEIQNFLKKKGLTDHRKFQNIYKIMHFEMQLENTRKIIQRICKKLNQLQAS